MSDNFLYQVFCKPNCERSKEALLGSFSSLVLAPFQLSLFAWRPVVDSAPMAQKTRAGRTPQQFLKSAEAYCVWRAGLSWRHSSDRWNAHRIAYLQAGEILRDAIHREVSPQLVIPALVAVVSPSPLERKFASRSRAWLVDELLKADPRLTDAKLLSRFPPKKLARMLAALPGRIERKRA